MATRNQLTLGSLVAANLALAGISIVSGQQLQNDAPRAKVRQQIDSRNIDRKDAPRVEQRSQSQARSRSSTQLLQSRIMTGAAVNLSGGVPFGEVFDFVLNADGCVQFVVVEYENHYYPFPWVVASFNAADAVLLLDVDSRIIDDAPTFTQITQLSDSRFVEQVRACYKVDQRQPEPRAEPNGDRARPKTNQPGSKREARPETRRPEERRPEAGAKARNGERRAAEGQPGEDVKKQPPGLPLNPKTPLSPTVPPLKEESVKPPAGAVR